MAPHSATQVLPRFVFCLTQDEPRRFQLLVVAQAMRLGTFHLFLSSFLLYFYLVYSTNRYQNGPHN